MSWGDAGDRECPMCGKDRVCSVREARAIFRTGDWGATAMLEDATEVCSYCHSVRIDGEWTRMETVNSRAFKLSQSSSNRDKGIGHYSDVLTSGEGEKETDPRILTGGGDEDRMDVDGVEW